jgi:alkylated DNA repair dioxygenase AlkB
MSKKRTLDSFFPSAGLSVPKKSRLSGAHDTPDSLAIPSALPPSQHQHYPWPIPHLPLALAEALTTRVPGQQEREVRNAPDLDLLHFEPFIPRDTARALFEFLRANLPFYRVRYTITRGSTETMINTPRYTTVFGVDSTSVFSGDEKLLQTVQTVDVSKPPLKAYGCKPRPIPECLDIIKRLVEAFTGAEYNFCLVNYYADGQDSIAYHSDDESFLGPEPIIASLSLGTTRDFLMRHKPLHDGRGGSAAIQGNKGTVARSCLGAPDGLEQERAIDMAARNPRKFPMGNGDMIVMRGRTQSHWLHSIPKRAQKSAGPSTEGGRINITFRRALVRGGTENYYHYNVGNGPAMKWSSERREMAV